MNKTVIISVFSLLLFGCKPEPKNISPNTYLSPEQQTKLKNDVVRYIDDLAKYANHQNKFDTIFDKEYAQKADKLDLIFVYKLSENDTIFFAISKIAPSMKIKKVVTAGKLIYNKTQKISYYQESFRTWKMEIPDLEKSTAMMFQKFVNNDDLSEFYTKNSNGKFLIEFPDDNNFFDTNARLWKFKGDKTLLK